jgi:hypothetical protein
MIRASHANVPGKTRPLYCGEWVRARNMKNKRFPANGPCEICLQQRIVPVWWSIKTGRIRCMKCFDAEAEHWRQVEAGGTKSGWAKP